MFSKIYSAQVDLLKTTVVSVETDLSKGLHSFSVVGLPSRSVDEAKDRVSSAIKNSGFKSPKSKNQKITISLAPADIKKEGPLFDLPIALGYLLSSGEVDFNPKDKMFIGELSLDGNLRPVKGVLPIVSLAKEKGFKEVYIPKENETEAEVVSGIDIFPAENLFDVICHLNTKKLDQDSHIKSKKIAKLKFKSISKPDYIGEYDLSLIKGQSIAKRALEVACAGGHNIVFYGPPGTGKTMLAKSAVSILPPLSDDEVFEVTSIYSVYDSLSCGLILNPPFRNPHHSSSYVSIVGGGSNIRPGEATLSHRGILFLDEMPEFDLKTLEALREPLEDGKIRIGRAKGSSVFPADFMLIGAMNPCPCGFFGVSGKECKCSAMSIEKYRRKLSGPLVDRIDIWVEVSSIDFDSLSDKTLSEKSFDVKKRVCFARDKQLERGKLNKNLSSRDLNSLNLDDDCKKILKDVHKRLDLSVRSFNKILKISRTIADLSESFDIKTEHIMEALQYRRKEQ